MDLLESMVVALYLIVIVCLALGGLIVLHDRLVEALQPDPYIDVSSIGSDKPQCGEESEECNCREINLR